jgi:hypothetical protein
MDKDPAMYFRHLLEAIAGIEADVAGYVLGLPADVVGF